MKLRFRGFDNPVVKGFDRQITCNDEYTIGETYETTNSSLMREAEDDVRAQFALVIGDRDVAKYVDLMYFDIVEDSNVTT